jgi:hypothetical protein
MVTMIGLCHWKYKTFKYGVCTECCFICQLFTAFNYTWSWIISRIVPMAAVWSFLLLDTLQFLTVSYINAYRGWVTHAQTRFRFLLQGAVWNGFSWFHVFPSHLSYMTHLYDQSPNQILHSQFPSIFYYFWLSDWKLNTYFNLVAMFLSNTLQRKLTKVAYSPEVCHHT